MPKVKKVGKCPNCGNALVWLIQDPEEKRIVHNILHLGCPNCKKMFQCKINYYSGEINLDETKEFNYDTFPRLDPELKITKYPKSRTKCPKCNHGMEIYIVDTPEIIGTTIFHCQNCSNVFDIPQEYEELPSLSVFKFSNEIHVFIAIVLKGIKTQKEPEYYPI